MKNYIGLLSRLHDTPLLMSLDKVRIITEAVTIPLLLGQASAIDRVESGSNATIKEFVEEYKLQGRSIAVISVFDSLVSKRISAGSGMTSYQDISARIDNAVENGATDIGFFMDTPGGEPSVFGLAEKIRSLPSRGIRTFSFCDQACSAGYAIAAATQKIYATQVASLGSIAAIAVHMEISKQANKEGKTYTVLRSKDQKALGDPYSELSEAAINNFTSMLATLDTEFDNDVVKSRPFLTLEGITKLAGKSLIGHDAVTAGLADKIVPNIENALSQFLEDSKTLTYTKPVGVTMSTQEDLQAQLDAANVKIASLETAATASLEGQDLAVIAETSRISTILSIAQTLKLDLAVATKYTDPKYSADIAKEILTDLAEATDAKVGLDNSTGAVEASGTVELEDSGLRAAFKAATNI